MRRAIRHHIKLKAHKERVRELKAASEIKPAQASVPLLASGVGSITTTPLTAQELHAFCESRVGYGNLLGRFWFLGAEEGFSNEATQDTLRTWLREMPVEDILEAHRKRDQMRHLDPVRGRSQKTWAFCIRLFLATTDQNPDLLTYRA